jgi:hypothetical protein
MSKLRIPSSPAGQGARKALYGLLESGRLWFENIKQPLLDYGFIQNRKDPCVFILFLSPHCLIVCLYVDDLLMISLV